MSDTPLTDASISQHTAYAGYGSYRVSMKVDHVEVHDCRMIERELTEQRDLYRQNQIELIRVIRAMLLDPNDRAVRSQATKLLMEMDSPEELQAEMAK